MKHQLLLVLLLIMTSTRAQVKDISFTFSPIAEYVWWDNQAGLGDDFLFGGKVGFGFGEYLELSGVFMTSEGMQTDFSSFGFSDFDAANFQQQDLRLTRWGGEAKINFSSAAVSPYVTLGTGIQNIKLSAAANSTEQIYASLGLGLRFALTDRINFLLEGRATGFNTNPVNSLLTPEQVSELGVNPSEFSSEDLLNFSALAALQIYLGGRKPGELSALDKAYLEKFKGGFKGWSWVLEPSIAYANFDSNSLYRNTWMAGAYFGTDFNEYVGVRTYFYQGLSDERISTDFERLNMYGLELRAKLNDGNGVVPYLILGGGRLNVQSGYLGSTGGLSAQSSNFANAGLGLDIPLGRNFLLTGGVRAMATSGLDTQTFDGTDVLQTHLLYNAGVKFQLGKKVDTSFTLDDSEANELQNIEKQLAISDNQEYQRLKQLRKSYEDEIQQLNEELKNATQQNNTKKAVEILEDKKRVEKSLSEVIKLQRIVQAPESNQGEYFKMTPEEFERLIDRILQGLDEKYAPQQQTLNQEKQFNEALLGRLIQLENQQKTEGFQSNDKTVQMLIEALVNERGQEATEEKDNSSKKGEPRNSNLEKEQLNRVNDSVSSAEIKRAEKEMMQLVQQNLEASKQREDELQQRMQELEKEIQAFNDRIEKKQEDNTTNSTESKVEDTKQEASKKKTSERKVLIKSADPSQNVGYNFIVLEKSSWVWNKLTYKGIAAFTGFNLGDQTTFNVGVRGHYGIGNTKFELLPEAFVGIADPTSYGGQLNMIYPFTIDKQNGLKAYLGAGGGFLEVAGSTNLNYNFVLGSYLNVFRGRLFVDYSIRNMFGNNAFSVGYRLPF